MRAIDYSEFLAKSAILNSYEDEDEDTIDPGGFCQLSLGRLVQATIQTQRVWIVDSSQWCLSYRQNRVLDLQKEMRERFEQGSGEESDKEEDPG
jgi:hypothetical protein